MWISLVIVLCLASGIIGALFGAPIAKHIFTILGRPFFKASFFYHDADRVSIDAEFNSMFIYELERLYRQRGQEKVLEPLDHDQDKVAVYLYDLISGIAEDYLPEENMEDIAPDVPMLGFRGGEEVRQVVDLGQPPDQKKGSKVDFIG